MGYTNKKIIYGALCLVSILLTACGGGGGGTPPPGGGGGGGTPPTYTIIGAVSGATLAGVTINLTGAATASATTDAGGIYSIASLVNGSYTVTPSKIGYTFNPANSAVSVSGANVGGTNFTATATGSSLRQMGGAIQGVALNLGGVVTTVAGRATVSGSTDGTGTAAMFAGPAGVTTDGTSLYVTDPRNATIRKIVIASGVVTTLAGQVGSSGSTDGTGTAATFYSPDGVTTDGTSLYVADNGNSIIRKIVIATGAVTTLAGQPRVLGHADGTGGAATFYYPQDVTTDGTNLYVSDGLNFTIRRIVIATGVVTTLAGQVGVSGSTDGTGSAATFNHPFGVTTDGTNLYVTDSGNNTIRRIVIATGAVTTLAGQVGVAGHADGTGTAATFNGLGGVTSDGTSLYVADSGNNTIRRIVIATGAVTTLAGKATVPGYADGTGTAATFNGLGGVTSDGASLYVTDYNNFTIRKIH